MDTLLLIVAAFFVPLFPFSMGFNALLGRTTPVAGRVLLILFWPQAGLWLMTGTNMLRPEWLVMAALMTSLLYAVRALALRDVNQWIGFLATSAWALLWISLMNQTPTDLVRIYAFGFSAPLVLLVAMSAVLERRFGAAYTGLYGGLAEATPRLAGVLVFIVLAVIATPIFPPFFVMLATIVEAMLNWPGVALGVIAVWIFWSWAGARLLHGLIAGPSSQSGVVDLSLQSTWSYSFVLLVLALAGLLILGALL